MFTGIIKNRAEVVQLQPEGSNLRIRLRSTWTPRLSIDQSVAHQGVCLTVDALHDDYYEVVAIQESLERTTIRQWKPGDRLNIELAMSASALLDGHILQGHVDKTLRILSMENKQGSMEYEIGLEEKDEALMVEKGSVALDGISLTCFGLTPASFRVAIIPYTLEHTSIRDWKKGTEINVEFDILNKIISKKVEVFFSQKYPQK